MIEWRECKLGELVESVSETYKFKPNEQVVFLNTSDILFGRVTNRLLQDSSNLPGQAKKRITKGDFLFSEIRPANGRYAVIDFNAENYVVSTKLMVLRCNDGIDRDYFTIFLTSKEQLDYLQQLAEDRSGTFPQITFDHISSLNISLPPPLEQKAIASVLSSLDDKIDLLHRQNKTLEAMAETLFRQWFVEEAGNNWGEEKLESIISVKGGTTPSTKEPDFWNGSIYWTTPRDLSSHDSVFLFDTQRKITDKGLAQIGSGLLPIGTVLLSSRAPIGYLSITNITVAINQGYIAIICDKVVSNLFIYLWCKANLDEIKNSGNGSVFQEISKSTFKAMAISLPPKKLLLEFDTKIFPIFNKIKINQSQIRTLETLRDTLLPKLMSGEVRVEHCRTLIEII